MTADVTVPRAAGPAPARWALLAGLAALLVAGAAAVLGVLAVPGPAREVTAWGGAASVAAVTAAVAVAAYCADTSRWWRRRAAALEEAADGLRQQAAELAERTLPAVAQQLRAGIPAATVLAEVTHPADATLRRLLLVVTRDLEEARHRAAAAMSATAAAAARMQAGATRMLADLRDLENRHADGPVFGGLLDLDHQVSQAGRLADSVALLSGGRSGRRWTRPIVMESILRGAAGRIDGYRRVRLHAPTTLAVSGHAAEGIMHALAELMDNATRFSAAGSEVRVSVQEAEAGALILVEDGGVGLQGRARRRAQVLVSGPADLSTLPGSGLGLASVGRVAARYGLTVSFGPSALGGTTAALMIPRPLVVPAAPDPVPAAAEPGRPARPARPGWPGRPRRAAPTCPDVRQAGRCRPGVARRPPRCPRMVHPRCPRTARRLMARRLTTWRLTTWRLMARRLTVLRLMARRLTTGRPPVAGRRAARTGPRARRGGHRIRRRDSRPSGRRSATAPSPACRPGRTRGHHDRAAGGKRPVPAGLAAGEPDGHGARGPACAGAVRGRPQAGLDARAGPGPGGQAGRHRVRGAEPVAQHRGRIR